MYGTLTRTFLEQIEEADGVAEFVDGF